MQKHTIVTPYLVGDIHIYTTEIDGELVLFDTGPPTAEALQYLQSHIDLKRLRHVLVTHCHVDHYGLAGWLADHTEAQIYLPHKDDLKLRRHGDRLEGIENLLLESGFDRRFVVEFRQTVSTHQVFPPVPKRYRVVEEAEVLEEMGIAVRKCPGHSQSDLVYLCGGCAITGDVLLRGIFQAPLLDLDLETFDGRFKNYDAYCSTVLELAKLRGRQILPGHREGVDSVDATILFYVGKLIERSAKLKRLPPQLPVSEVVERLFGSESDPFVAYLKASEIFFMQDFLADPQKLKNSLEQIGLFQAVEPAFRALIRPENGVENE